MGIIPDYLYGGEYLISEKHCNPDAEIIQFVSWTPLWPGRPLTSHKAGGSFSGKLFQIFWFYNHKQIVCNRPTQFYSVYMYLLYEVIGCLLENE